MTKASKLSLLLLLTFLPAEGQTAEKKEFVFLGIVVKVEAGAKPLTVTNEPIPGWMGGMTMTYAVDKPDAVMKIPAGARITAKVYEGDYTLHEVQVVAESSAGSGMRLEELEKIALDSNPTMAQAQANLRAAAGLARQAGLYPNPTIGYWSDDVRGGYQRGGKQGGFVSQTIVTGGKLAAARRVAQLESDQMETSGQIQRQRILNNVRSLFYEVLASQRLVEVRKNIAQLAADATRTSYQLGNIGQADRPDILQAEVEQQQSGVNLAIAQRALEGSWRLLATVAGKPGLPLTHLEGDLDQLPDLNYTEWLAAALRDSPEIKLAQQASQRAEASLSQAKKAVIPDIQLMGTLSQNNAPLLENNPLRATGVQGGGQVGVELPVFNRNQGNIAAARAEVESARQDAARRKLQLERDLAGLFRAYDSARVTALQYRTEMLPRAEQAYKLFQTSYQKMAAAYPQVLISQRTLFQLEADYIQALATAWQAAVAIQGFGLMDGLAEPQPARRIR